MSIYTKKGDDGKTHILGEKRVKKSCIEIMAIGSLDELNASLGVLLSLLDKRFNPVKKNLQHIQHTLFVVGAHVAGVQTDLQQIPAFKKEEVLELERWIDNIEKELPVLKQFILPNGSIPAAQTFLARAVCRHAERDMVKLTDHYEVNPLLLQYINRLSDFLFLLARWINKKLGVEEVVWKK